MRPHPFPSPPAQRGLAQRRSRFINACSRRAAERRHVGRDAPGPAPIAATRPAARSLHPWSLTTRIRPTTPASLRGAAAHVDEHRPLRSCAIDRRRATPASPASTAAERTTPPGDLATAPGAQLIRELRLAPGQAFYLNAFATPPRADRYRLSKDAKSLALQRPLPL